MELIELYDRIAPCDMDKPYVFVSYSSKDSDVVWTDVCHLQQLGYNIWIDKNLKETDDSWKNGKNGAYKAIEDIDCKLVLFYLSESSIISDPCFKELTYRESKTSRDRHNGETIPWIAIEVNPIDSIKDFRDNIFKNINLSELDRNIKNEMAETLSKMIETFFPDEDRPRIKSIRDNNRRYDYYKRVEERMQEHITKYSPEQIYEYCIDLFEIPSGFKAALNILEYCAEKQSYIPASLLLAFILKTGVCGITDMNRADSLLWISSLQETEEIWESKAESLKKEKKFKTAIAYFSALGIKMNSADAFSEATKMWLNLSKSSYRMTLKCAELADEYGNKECKKLHNGLKAMSEGKFYGFVKTRNK